MSFENLARLPHRDAVRLVPRLFQRDFGGGDQLQAVDAQPVHRLDAEDVAVGADLVAGFGAAAELAENVAADRVGEEARQRPVVDNRATFAVSWKAATGKGG